METTPVLACPTLTCHSIPDTCCVHQGPRTPQSGPSMLMPAYCLLAHPPACPSGPGPAPLFPAKDHFLLLVSGLTSHFTAELCNFAFQPSSLGSSSHPQTPSAFWSLSTSAAAAGTCILSVTTPPCTHMHTFIHICAHIHHTHVLSHMQIFIHICAHI